jgi:hypothetical protein
MPLILLLPYQSLQAQLWGLPTWVEEAAKAAEHSPTPVGADAWVLLDHTMLTYRGEGEIRKTRTRVVRIITQRGESEGTFLSRGLGQKVSKIRKLKGWNLRPDRAITRLDRDDLVSIDADAFENRTVSPDTLALATLPSVQPGSLIAFESQESIRFPLGPIDLIFPLETCPIFHYRLEWGLDLPLLSSRKETKTVSLQTRNLLPWSPEVHQGDRFIEIRNLPGRPTHEPWASAGLETLPYISVVFHDPFLTGCPSLADWNEYGRWVYHQYSALAEKVMPVPLDGKNPKNALLALVTWMRASLSYRQVYLSAERGWIPERSTETLRRRYGDCKDLATCLIAGARSASLEGWPTLARVNRGSIPRDAPVHPYLFNHVITAIHLEQSLGFPAEVETPCGRFLLIDPTSRTTPVGLLPAIHRNGRLLLCGPEGAVWVEVPDFALERERVDYRIEGTVSVSGWMKGRLTIAESGDALGLRSTALLQGDKVLRDRTLQLSTQALPPSWVIEASPLPNDPARPFVVTIAFECANAMVLKGNEWTLALPAFPKPPPPVNRTAGERHFPIDVPKGFDARWEVHLGVEGMGELLVGPPAQISTVLRDAEWKASAHERALDLVLEVRSKPAHWPPTEQEKAFKALKQDRGEFMQFLENALNFQVKP